MVRYPSSWGFELKCPVQPSQTPTRQFVAMACIPSKPLLESKNVNNESEDGLQPRDI